MVRFMFSMVGAVYHIQAIFRQFWKQSILAKSLGPGYGQSAHIRLLFVSSSRVQ